MDTNKFLTVDCSLLDNDEFDYFVTDLERYISTRADRGRVPQQASRKWLRQFAKDYFHWPERQYKMNRYTMEAYFQIGVRTC